MSIDEFTIYHSTHHLWHRERNPAACSHAIALRAHVCPSPFHAIPRGCGCSRLCFRWPSSAELLVPLLHPLKRGIVTLDCNLPRDGAVPVLVVVDSVDVQEVDEPRPLR